MQQGAGHGGYRAGAGRKPKYGSSTVVMRVPTERVDDVERFLLCGDPKEIEGAVEGNLKK